MDVSFMSSNAGERGPSVCLVGHTLLHFYGIENITQTSPRLHIVVTGDENVKLKGLSLTRMTFWIGWRVLSTSLG